MLYSSERLILLLEMSQVIPRSKLNRIIVHNAFTIPNDTDSARILMEPNYTITVDQATFIYIGTYSI